MAAKVLLNRTDEDPLERVTAPPANETPEAKKVRLEAEALAKQVSDAIDEELNRQRVAERKAPKPVKVLLLGQSESGKSTTLKNFQLMHSAKAFRAERASWRAVIQLNVVRSILLILNAMSNVQGSSINEVSAPTSPWPNTPRTSKDLPILTDEHMKLKMRLSPLHKLEESLRRRLAPGGSVEFEATQFPQSSLRELVVNSSMPWKSAFGKLLPSGGRGSLDGEDSINWDDPNDPGVVLHACSEDMIKLWNDPTIRTLLDKQGMRVEEMAGFFLDSLERVSSARYVPSDDDILRARLKTMGVSEHRFEMKSGHGISRHWRIYDVGGQRSQRTAWVPFFEDVDSIIFLAPISCFDQVLQEDRTVNRLEDSYNLYKAVVSNPLLKNANIVLFLNKIDILQAKLASGVQMRKFVVSYGDRPNDYEHVSNYLRRKFAGILKESSPLPRMFYAHFTAVTNTESTSLILANIKDMLMRQSLQETSLM